MIVGAYEKNGWVVLDNDSGPPVPITGEQARARLQAIRKLGEVERTDDRRMRRVLENVERAEIKARRRGRAVRVRCER